MFPTLQELKNLLGRGFLLGVFFPVLIFVSTSLLLYFEVTQGVRAALAVWEKFALQTQVLTFVGGLIATAVLASLIYNFQYSITRLFEGYWPRIGALHWLRKTRIELYRQRWVYLESRVQSGALTDAEKAGIIGEQITFYPPRKKYLDKLMPTRIGNILRASEIYAYDHYGIDSVIIWTRLHPLLTREAIAPLENNQTTIDFMLLMSVLAATFTLIWCLALALFTTRWDLFLLCSLGWPLAWVCYQNAVQRALVFSEQFKVIFDLHRHDLLKALNLPIPVDADEEREQWKEISEFFYLNIPIPVVPIEPDKPTGWDQVALALAEYIKKVNPPTIE